MKRRLLLIFAFTVIVILFPTVVGLCTQVSETEAAAPSDKASIELIRAGRDNIAESDSSVYITLEADGKIQKLPLCDYLIGVVAAEMPASFEPEALKAQTVAARTYVVHKIIEGSPHEQADVCTDPSCCQAYCARSGFEEKWGQDLDKNLEKIEKAVAETDGEILLYSGSPILAAFHASSFGMTEDCGSVWGSDVPYLKSVPSPETDKDVPNLTTGAYFTEKEFRDKLLSKYPDAVFPDDHRDYIGECVYDAGGRVESIEICGIRISGVKMRSIFSLRSTLFTLSASDEGFSFSVKGSGHGVGMSQYGANILASMDYPCEDILAWYYPGTELGTINDIK